jgi:high-affinity nickel permease
MVRITLIAILIAWAIGNLALIGMVLSEYYKTMKKYNKIK